MRPVVKQKNFLGFKIWLEKLGYKVKQLDGGFVARAKSREAQRAYKKSHHYVRVGSDLSGNQAAYELGAEYEMHLRCPAISDETNENLARVIANQIMKVV